MYCPNCFNNTLHIKSRGVMNIVINSKQMDAGRFLYNFNDDKEVFLKDLSTKLEEFFKWYSGFDNSEPITKIEITTADVGCESGCRLSPGGKFSVFDSNVLSVSDIAPILKKLGVKYQLEIEIVSQ